MSKRRWFALLLIPFLLMSLNRLGSTRLLGYHHYRQAHTALAAHNYAFYDANLLHPTIDGVTYGKDLYLNEFPLYPYVVGTLWRFLGEHLIVARLVSIAFMVLALWYYVKLLERFIADRLIVSLALVAMSLAPVVSYFGRCVERQSMFLFLLLWGTYGLVVYLEEGRKRALLPGSLGLSLAILLNPFAVYMALPLGWYALKRRGVRACADWRLWLVAACAVVPALAWYGYAAAISRSLATQEMLAVHDHRNFTSLEHYASWADPSNWARLWDSLVRYVTPSVPALAVCLYGAVAAPRAAGYGLFKVWLLAVAAYHLIDFYPVAIVVHHYYFLNTAPLTSLFLAYGLARLGRTGWNAAIQVIQRDGSGWLLRVAPPRAPATWLRGGLVVLAAGWFLLGAVIYNREMHRDNWHAGYYAIRNELAQHVPEGQRVTVIAESEDPLFSYVVADRLTHRLAKYSPPALDRVIAQQDFDYLAILWDTPQFPLDTVVRTVERAGYLGQPVLRIDNLMLFERHASLASRPAGPAGAKR